MKNLFILFLAFTVVGCAYEGHKIGDYLGDPRTIIRDPHFTEYKEKRDNLERSYLNEKISFADYMEQMKALDENYTREVQHRESVISAQ